MRGRLARCLYDGLDLDADQLAALGESEQKFGLYRERAAKEVEEASSQVLKSSCIPDQDPNVNVFGSTFFRSTESELRASAVDRLLSGITILSTDDRTYCRALCDRMVEFVSYQAAADVMGIDGIHVTDDLEQLQQSVFSSDVEIHARRTSHASASSTCPDAQKQLQGKDGKKISIMRVKQRSSTKSCPGAPQPVSAHALDGGCTSLGGGTHGHMENGEVQLQSSQLPRLNSFPGRSSNGRAYIQQQEQIPAFKQPLETGDDERVEGLAELNQVKARQNRPLSGDSGSQRQYLLSARQYGSYGGERRPTSASALPRPTRSSLGGGGGSDGKTSRKLPGQQLPWWGPSAPLMTYAMQHHGTWQSHPRLCALSEWVMSSAAADAARRGRPRPTSGHPGTQRPLSAAAPLQRASRIVFSPDVQERLTSMMR